MTTQSVSASSSAGSGLGANLAGPFGVSLAAIAIGVIVGVWGFVTIVSAVFGKGTGDVQPDKEIDRLMAMHQEDLQTWQDRFNGRSAFFKPPAPYVAPPPPPETPVVEKPPVEEPKIDTVYRGPSIAFAYADVVYFNPISASEAVKYLRIRVGEERSGLKVLAVSLPWAVKVGYKGGEYDVPVFNRNDESTFLLSTPKPVILTKFLVAVPGSDGFESGVTPDAAAGSTLPASETTAISVQPAVASPETISSPGRPAPPGRSSRGNRGGRGGEQELPRPNPPQPEPEPAPSSEEVGEEPAPSDDTVPEDVEPPPAPESPRQYRIENAVSP